MRNHFVSLGAFAALLLSSACSSVEEPFVTPQPESLPGSRSAVASGTIIDVDSALVSFASTLSKAVYDRRDVREFLKEQAQLRFDMNPELLYGAVSDVEINGSTFREILVSYSSEEEMASIECSAPLLNILIPEFPMIDITVENMDCSDYEIPVAIHGKDGMGLYLNGHLEMTIPDGELPAFHSIVVNENSRVIVEPVSRGSGFQYSFISPNYDRFAMLAASSRAFVETLREQVGERAIQAHNRFWTPDDEITSRNLQRDYIYYGLTPNHPTNGHLYKSSREYLGYLRVDPKAYFIMTNEIGNDPTDDPHILANSVSRKDKDFTEEQLIAKFWSANSYNFRFELYSGDDSKPVIGRIALRPHEIWNFNLDKTFEHATWFKKRKYTYKINVDKFTAKIVDVTSKGITFGRPWDLSKEGVQRYISIIEEDKGTEITYEKELDFTRVGSGKVNGSVKIDLGIANIGIGTDLGASETTTEKKVYKVTKKMNDDEFGTVIVYFYDPFILGTSNNNYVVYPYSVGEIQFGLYLRDY